MDYCYKMEELVPIVGKLAQRYTAGESTSVTYEKAEQLMGAVLYCIRELAYAEHENESYGTGSGSGACGAESVGCGGESCGIECTEHGGDSCERDQQKCGISASQEKLPARQAYERGLACVEEKVRKALSRYNALMLRFDTYGNRCLYDTVVKGIPEFFKWYDVRFAPQDTILTLDYPVLRDLSAYTGIDRIYEYLLCIEKEQALLRTFPRDDVLDALARYNPAYEDMIDNVCGAVKVLLGK